jgi:hypothetical protein
MYLTNKPKIGIFENENCSMNSFIYPTFPILRQIASLLKSLVLFAKNVDNPSELPNFHHNNSMQKEDNISVKTN